MSPARRGAAVDHLTDMFEVSQRRACVVVGQPRSTQRLPRTAVPDAEQHLRRRLRDLAAVHPRYGYRRLGVLLAREGYRVNHKRVQRLCRDEGLCVRVKKRKRSRVGASTIPNNGLTADHPNHVLGVGCRLRPDR